MTSMKDFKGMGGMVSPIPVKKEIKFKLDGDEELSGTIHVKRLAIGDYEALFLVDGEERSRTAKIISEAVSLGPDGKERISFKDAYQLHPALAGAMIVAFNEVNAAKKSSPPATGSSAN